MKREDETKRDILEKEIQTLQIGKQFITLDSFFHPQSLFGGDLLLDLAEICWLLAEPGLTDAPLRRVFHWEEVWAHDGVKTILSWKLLYLSLQGIIVWV